MRSNFFENIKAIENTLFNSDTFKFILNSGLEKEAIGGVVADIFKQAINGALNLEELEVKAKTENIAYEKSKIDMELAVLNAKAQIKTAQAEAIKSLIQAKAMVRSVVDNAAINRANGYVGLANVIGNASEQKALTAKEMAGERVGGIAAIAAENIEKIDISQINDFDNLLDALIKDDRFISKDVLIVAEKSIIMLGEIISLQGVSSFGKNESFWSINDKKVCKNRRNYLFEAHSLGDFIITFGVKNDKGELISDTITLKVVPSSAQKGTPIKKF